MVYFYSRIKNVYNSFLSLNSIIEAYHDLPYIIRKWIRIDFIQKLQGANVFSICSSFLFASLPKCSSWIGSIPFSPDGGAAP